MFSTETPALTTSQRLSWKLSLWRAILSTALGERLVYRGDFALGTLMRFLPIVTQLFVWYEIFESIEAPKGG